MSKDEVPNPPAFPRTAKVPYASDNDGMTLRDWFAGQALDAIIRVGNPSGGVGTVFDMMAQDAYHFADAMLRARLPAAALAAIDEQGE